jgi:activating signal cointegrator 1
MKVLSLWQPWASLVAHGLKKIETRGWDATPYRGPLAIHATLAWNSDCRDLAGTDRCWQPLRETLRLAAAKDVRCRVRALRETLPFGAIIATCMLEESRGMEHCPNCDGCGWYEGGAAIKTGCADCGGGGVVPWSVKISAQERAFGNYEIGRYGFILGNAAPLPLPIAFRGRQAKLLDLPSGIKVQIDHQMVAAGYRA